MIFLLEKTEELSLVVDLIKMYEKQKFENDISDGIVRSNIIDELKNECISFGRYIKQGK
ncbi:MAG: hypothetical protein ACOC2U_04515 [bacterium]